MSNRAKYLGAVGTIIDGRLRDLQEHRDLDFPVSMCSPKNDIPDGLTRCRYLHGMSEPRLHKKSPA